MMTVTTTEILAELRKAAIKIEDGATAQEIAEALGIHEQQVWRKMRGWIKAGEWRYVPVKRMTVTGILRTVPGYQPVKAKRK